MQTRLLALDVDGTLFDLDGRLSPAVRASVQKARDRGLIVVICTGRRFRTVRPLLRDLDLAGPVVVHNGVVVKDALSGETLANQYFGAELYDAAMKIMRGVVTPLVYVDQYHESLDLYTEPSSQCHEFQAEYVADNAKVVRLVENLDAPPTDSVIMLSAMADQGTLDALQLAIASGLGDCVETNFLANKMYQGHILEVVRQGASKWSGLLGVANGLGINAGEIAAIGDDNNDLAMIQHAGIGIAMGNAVPDVLAAADHVTASNAEDGAALAIEGILQGRIVSPND